MVGVATIAFKAAGPVLIGRRALPATRAVLVDLLAPVMLVALVVTQTFGGDEEIEVDARVRGRRAPLSSRSGSVRTSSSRWQSPPP